MQPDFHNEYARGTTCSTGGECAMWRIFATLFLACGKRGVGTLFRVLGFFGGLCWLTTVTRITVAWQTLR
jgi:hypothetical protein